MKRLVTKSPTSWSKLPVFLSGMVLGAVVALATPVFSASKDFARNALTGVLYAIAELAVDTETNAGKIVALTQRVGELEDLLEEISGKNE